MPAASRLRQCRFHSLRSRIPGRWTGCSWSRHIVYGVQLKASLRVGIHVIGWSWPNCERGIADVTHHRGVSEPHSPELSSTVRPTGRPVGRQSGTCGESFHLALIMLELIGNCSVRLIATKTVSHQKHGQHDGAAIATHIFLGPTFQYLDSWQWSGDWGSMSAPRWGRARGGRRRNAVSDSVL